MATPGKKVEDPREALQAGAYDLFRRNNPAEEVVAGKVKTRQGVITGVTVLWPLPAIPGKPRVENQPKVDHFEIDNIGKVFNSMRRQPAGRPAVWFKFRDEDYQARREECSPGAHMRGAVCFSGSKPNTTSQEIYAMVTKDGYIVIVKTKSFTATRMLVEGSKGLAQKVQSAAIRAATSR